MNLAVDDLSFSYPGGVTALRGISLKIGSGEAVAFIGENGAGKTTLAKHLNGLLEAAVGRVVVGDWDASEHTVAEMASRVGFVFQNPDDQLFARTVWDEVAFGPRNLGRPEEVVQSNVVTALEQVGLSSESKSHPYDLSFSQRKLVALAAILVMKTPMVILDEPTTGQDGFGVALVGEIVESLKAEGRTVLAISHDIDFCAEHFGRVVVMSGGKVAADGAARTILGQGELLQRADVDPPQLVRLATALSMPATPLTVDEFVDAYKEQKDDHRARRSPR